MKKIIKLLLIVIILTLSLVSCYPLFYEGDGGYGYREHGYREHGYREHEYRHHEDRGHGYNSQENRDNRYRNLGERNVEHHGEN